MPLTYAYVVHLLKLPAFDVHTLCTIISFPSLIDAHISQAYHTPYLPHRNVFFLMVLFLEQVTMKEDTLNTGNCNVISSKFDRGAASVK